MSNVDLTHVEFGTFEAYMFGEQDLTNIWLDAIDNQSWPMRFRVVPGSFTRDANGCSFLVEPCDSPIEQQDNPGGVSNL